MTRVFTIQVKAELVKAVVKAAPRRRALEVHLVGKGKALDLVCKGSRCQDSGLEIQVLIHKHTDTADGRPVSTSVLACRNVKSVRLLTSGALKGYASSAAVFIFCQQQLYQPSICLSRNLPC